MQQRIFKSTLPVVHASVQTLTHTSTTQTQSRCCNNSIFLSLSFSLSIAPNNKRNHSNGYLAAVGSNVFAQRRWCRCRRHNSKKLVFAHLPTNRYLRFPYKTKKKLSGLLYRFCFGCCFYFFFHFR